MLNSPEKESAAERRARLEELERRQSRLQQLCEAALQEGSSLPPTETLTAPFSSTRRGGNTAVYQDDLLTGEVQSFRDPASAARASSLMSSAPRDSAGPFDADLPPPRPSYPRQWGGSSYPYGGRDGIVETPDSTRSPYRNYFASSTPNSHLDRTASRPPPPVRSESRDPPRPPPRSSYYLSTSTHRYPSARKGPTTPPPPVPEETTRHYQSRTARPPPPAPAPELELEREKETGTRSGAGVFDTRNGKYSRVAAYRKYRSPQPGRTPPPPPPPAPAAEEDDTVYKWRRQLFDNEESLRPLKKKYGATTPPPPVPDSPPRRSTPIPSPSVDLEGPSLWDVISTTTSEHRRNETKLRNYLHYSEPVSSSSSFRKPPYYPSSSSSRYPRGRVPRYERPKKQETPSWPQYDTPRSRSPEDDLVESISARGPPPPPPEDSVPRSPSVSPIDVAQAAVVAKPPPPTVQAVALKTIHPYGPPPTVVPESFKREQKNKPVEPAAATARYPPPPSVSSEVTDVTSGTRRPPLGVLSSNKENGYRIPQEAKPRGSTPHPQNKNNGADQRSERLPHDTAALPQDVAVLQKGLLEAKKKAEDLARHLVKAIKEKKQLLENTNELETMVEETNLEVGRLQRIVEDQQKEAVAADGLRAALRAKEEEVYYCEQEIRRLNGVVEAHVQRITEAGHSYEEKETRLLLQTEELQAALTEVGVAHVAQREAEERAEQLAAELEGAVEQIQELDERLAEMEKQSASVWLAQLNKNVDLEGGLPEGVKLPGPQQLRGWPAEARTTVAALIATTKGLLSQRESASKTSTTSQQLHVLEHQCSTLKQQLREKAEQLDELQSECLLLKGDKNALIHFSAEQLRQLRGVKDEAQLVSEFIRTSREEAEEVVMGCRSAEVELGAHRLSAKSASPFSASHQELQEETVASVQEKTSKSIKFAQQVMRDMHAVARFLAAVREMNIDEENGYQILSSIAHNRSPSDKLFYLTDREGSPGSRREPSPVVREKINRRKQFVVEAIEKVLQGEQPPATLQPVSLSDRTAIPTEALRSAPRSSDVDYFHHTNPPNRSNNVHDADPFYYGGEDDDDNNDEDDANGMEEAEIELPADVVNFSNISTDPSRRGPRNSSSRHRYAEREREEDFYYGEDNGGVTSTSTRVPLQSIRRESEETEKGRSSSPFIPPKTEEDSPLRRPSDAAEFAKQKFCSPLRMGAAPSNKSSEISHTAPPSVREEATVVPVADSTPSRYSEPEKSSRVNPKPRSTTTASDHPSTSLDEPQEKLKPSFDHREEAKQDPQASQDSLSLSDIPFENDIPPARRKDSKDHSIASLPARPKEMERTPLASPPRDDPGSSPDSSPLRRPAGKEEGEGLEGLPTSRRLMVSPTRDSEGVVSQPKDRSVTAPPAEREMSPKEFAKKGVIQEVLLMDDDFIMPSQSSKQSHVAPADRDNNNNNNNSNKKVPSSGSKFNQVPVRPDYSTSTSTDEEDRKETERKETPRALPNSLPPLHPNSRPASAKSSPAASHLNPSRSTNNNNNNNSQPKGSDAPQPIVKPRSHVDDDDDDDEEPSLSFFNANRTPTPKDASPSSHSSDESSEEEEEEEEERPRKEPPRTTRPEPVKQALPSTEAAPSTDSLPVRRPPATAPATTSEGVGSGAAPLPRLQRSSNPSPLPSQAEPSSLPATPPPQRTVKENGKDATAAQDTTGPVLSEPQKPSPSRPQRPTTEIQVDEDELLDDDEEDEDEEGEVEHPISKRNTVSPSDVERLRLFGEDSSTYLETNTPVKPALSLPPMASGTPSLMEMPQPAAPLQPAPRAQDSGRKQTPSPSEGTSPTSKDLPTLNTEEPSQNRRDLFSREKETKNTEDTRRNKTGNKNTRPSGTSSATSTPRSRGAAAAELSEDEIKRKEEVAKILERIREKKAMESKRSNVNEKGEKKEEEGGESSRD